MRILHTSDWHLGQNFYSKSRAAEHLAFLDWLLETAQSHQVDAIIVAGDIFDTGSPPSYARELYNRFVVNLQQTGCHLVVLAGNHDSVATLNESRDILAFLNTTVVASAGHAPQYLYRCDGTPGAVLCPIPFLRPRDIITSQAGLSGNEKQQHLLGAITDYYQQQYQEACKLRGDGDQTLPVIATGHLTTVGASKSDAVRDIYIGTLDDLPGTYSLTTISSQTSLDEQIACHYILSGDADLLINVVDASNLERNLYLTLQLLELGIPCIVALNMLDIAEKQQVRIDIDALSARLGCPVVPLVSTRGRGIEALKLAIDRYKENENVELVHYEIGRAHV